MDQKTTLPQDDISLEEKLSQSLSDISLEEKLSQSHLDISLEEKLSQPTPGISLEEKLSQSLSHISLEQTDQLLDHELNLKVKRSTCRRVERMVMTRLQPRPSGFRLRRSALACVIALALLFVTAGFIGFDKVGQAFQQLFHFLPGFGITTSTELKYTLASPIFVENDEHRLSLISAAATEDALTVMLTLERKNFNEDVFLSEKKAEWEHLQNGGNPEKQRLILYVGDEAFEEFTGFTGSDGRTDSSTFTFRLKSKHLDTSTNYRLEYENYGLSMEFCLADVKEYASLEEIGATDIHNNISITATSSIVGGRLAIDLFGINTSEYRLVSFHHSYEPYHGASITLADGTELHLPVDSAAINGANRRYYFDVRPSSPTLTLTVPYISVTRQEQKDVTVKIPKNGEVLTPNKKVAFADGTMTIQTTEVVEDQAADYRALKMTVSFDTNNTSMVFLYPEMHRINLFGAIKGSSSSMTHDEQGKTATLYLTLGKKESGSVKLRFQNPMYYLTDEYTLEITNPLVKNVVE